jgi:hypothetical protein
MTYFVLLKTIHTPVVTSQNQQPVSTRLERNYARRLLALACASREAARAEAIRAQERLREGQRAVELLMLQAQVAKVTLREAGQNVEVVRRALDALDIPEVSFSDDEDDHDVADGILFISPDSDSDHSDSEDAGINNNGSSS